MCDVHTVEIIVLSSATRKMATKAETIRQTTLRVDWVSPLPGGAGGRSALDRPSSLTSALVLLPQCLFIDSGRFIPADWLLPEVEEHGGGMVRYSFH